MRLLLATLILLAPLPISHTRAAFAGRPAAPPQTVATPTPSPTPAATPTPDPELQEAERQAKLAAEEKKREEAERDAAKARGERLKAITQPLGAPNNVSVPQGNVQTDAAGWAESQALSQEAARQITERMTRFLCNAPKAVNGNALTIDNVVVYNQADFAALEVYDSVAEQLKQLVREFDSRHADAVKAFKETDPTVAFAPPDAIPDVSSAGAADIGVEALFAAPGIATGLVKSVAELVNLFRTDTSFVNQALVVNEDVIVSQVADYLSAATPAGATDRCSQRFSIYYPSFVPARLPLAADGTEPACPAGVPSVTATLETVSQKRFQALADIKVLGDRIEQLTKLGAAVTAKAEREKALKDKTAERAEKKEKLDDPNTPASVKKKLELEIAALDEEIKTLREKLIPDAIKAIRALSGKGNVTEEQFQKILQIILDNAPKFDEWKKRLAELKTKTEQLVASTEQLLARLNTPAEATQLTPLARLVRAERLRCVLGKPKTYILRVSVNANGTTKIKKNFFVDAKVRHSARAGLVYQLFDPRGQVMKGSSMQCYIDYQSSRGVYEAVGEGARKVECKTPPPAPTPTPTPTPTVAAGQR